MTLNSVDEEAAMDDRAVVGGRIMAAEAVLALCALVTYGVFAMGAEYGKVDGIGWWPPKCRCWSWPPFLPSPSSSGSTSLSSGSLAGLGARSAMPASVLRSGTTEAHLPLRRRGAWAYSPPPRVAARLLMA